MANQIIPVIQFAHELYDIGLEKGLPEDLALTFARAWAGGHCLDAGIHRFSDEEIRTGKCGCAGCRSRSESPAE